MTKIEHSQSGIDTPARESRAYPRRKVSGMAYVEMAEDNGGILLNLGEGGLAVQCALAVTARELPHLRFQMPRRAGWLAAPGRVTWISESKKEAGIAFVDLPEDTRARIRAWVAGETPEAQVRTSAERAAALLELNRKVTAARREAATSETSPLEVESPDTVADERKAPAKAEPAHTEAAAAKNGSKDAAPEPVYTFHDYSMFGGANLPEPQVWAEAKPRTSWGKLTLLGFLVAAVFFVLGATVQHGDMNRLLTYVGAKAQDLQLQGEARQVPVAVSPANGTESEQQRTTEQGSSSKEKSGTPMTGAGVASADESDKQNPENAEALQNDDAQASADDNDDGPDTNASAVDEQNPTHAPRANEQASSAQHKLQPLMHVDQRSKNDRASAVAPKLPVTAPAFKQPKKLSVANRSATEIAGAYGSSAPDAGHFLLVNAPAPGSPPLFVALPPEPVSASATVAITARRSIEVPPRAEPGYQPERVNVGTLVAHSDPYYPADARSRRIDGSVELEAVVGRTGQVISVQPISGPTLLASAAATALHEWRYEPTFVDGDPVETRAHVIMVFRLPY